MPLPHSDQANATSSPSTRALLKELDTELQAVRGNYNEVVEQLSPILTPQLPTLQGKEFKEENTTAHSEINLIILDLIERARSVKSDLYFITDRIIL